jgi:hypothetical protein
VANWLGRRKHGRYPIVIPILYGSKDAGPVMTGAGWTRDLGEGGACLELSERLETSAFVHLFLRTDQGGIEAEAQIIWAEGPLPTGGILHGVAFTQLASTHQEALRELLLRKRMVWQAVVRIPRELYVTYQIKGQPRSLNQGQTENISRRGLLLRLALVYPPGTPLEVTLQTPHGPLKAEGVVVRVEPLEAQSPGQAIRHGFHFLAISHETQMTLARVLAEPR